MGHAEQLLFSCLCSKVSGCQVVEVVKFGRWDMLNKFCFHVHADKSLCLVENCNGFFGTSSSSSREFANPRAGSQLKKIKLFGQMVPELLPLEV